MSLEREKPTWEPLPLRCGACGTEWDDWQPSHVAVGVWVAAIEALRCPKCGERKHLLMQLVKS